MMLLPLYGKGKNEVSKGAVGEDDFCFYSGSSLVVGNDPTLTYVSKLIFVWD